MSFNRFNKYLKYFLLVVLLKPIPSQISGDNMMDMDTIYRNNTSLKSLDSLFLSIPKNKPDTSFTNPIGTAEIMTLDQMIYFARFKNPELSSMTYQIESKQIFGKSDNYLPDPMFEFETDDVASNLKKVGMINFYITQVFPYPGKIGLEKKSALYSSDMLELEHHNMETELINMIKMNYYDLFLINQKLKLNRDNQLLLKTMESAAESKYSVGKGMQQEVFKSQIELSRLMNDEKILSLQQNTILNNLSRLTRTEISEKTKVIFNNIDIDLLLDKDCFDFEAMNRDAIVQFAFEKRADLKSIKEKILMDQTDIDIAKRKKYPDLAVRAGYKILPFEDHNAFNFMIGINVPIAPWSWGKYDVDIQKSELMRKSSEQDYEAKRLEIKNQVDTAINSLISLKESMLYYHNVLLPQTENSLKSTQYNYENNMTSFLDLLDSYRMYLDAQNMFYESVTMYLKMIADLEKTTGMNFKY